MKTKYKKVIDFYNTTTPEQHAYFLDLIKDRLHFYNLQNQEYYSASENHFIYTNGALIQINIE